MTKKRSEKIPNANPSSGLNHSNLVTFGPRTPPTLETPALEADLLSIKEAADLLRVKVATLYVWCQRRYIPHRKHGGKLLFSKRGLSDWSKAQEIPPNDAA